MRVGRGKRLTKAAIAGGLSLAIAGCGGGSESDAASLAPPQSSPVVLADLLAYDPVLQAVRIDEAVVQCMGEQGFEYYPTAPPEVGADPLAALEAEMGPAAFAEQFGLGISTTAFLQSTVGPDLVGLAGVDTALTGQPEANRNDVFLDALTPQEQDAYAVALFGPDDGPLDNAGATDRNQEPQGCLAQARAFETSTALYDDFVETFAQDLAEIDALIAADPRIVEAQLAAASCVNEKGVVFSSLDEAYEEITTELQSLSGEAVGMPEGITEPELAVLAAENPDGIWGSFTVQLNNQQRSHLASLQAREQTLAVALLECNAGAAGAADLYQSVRADYEARFVTDEAGRLSEFKAAYAD